MQESRRLGHNYVGTEMLLVGVVAASRLSCHRPVKTIIAQTHQGHLRSFGQSFEEVQRHAEGFQASLLCSYRPIHVLARTLGELWKRLWDAEAVWSPWRFWA